MTTPLNGLVGGAVVALLAVAVTKLLGDGPGATADDESVSRRLAVGLKLLYGGLAGGVLVALDLFVLGRLGVPPALGEALRLTVGWSAVLLGTVVVLRRLGHGCPFDRAARGEILAYHLVYGVGLGIWIRATWMT